MQNSTHTHNTIHDPHPKKVTASEFELLVFIVFVFVLTVLSVCVFVHIFRLPNNLMVQLHGMLEMVTLQALTITHFSRFLIHVFDFIGACFSTNFNFIT